MRMQRAMGITAAIGFAVATIAAIVFGHITAIAAMAVCAIVGARTARALERARIDRTYQLMARIGDGELGATNPASEDELELRLQRAVARAQRGFSEALAHAEAERDEMRSLLGAIDKGLLSLDAHLRIRSANPVAERLLGLPASSYRGRLLAEVIRQSELLRFVERAASGDGATTTEIAITGGSVDSLLVAAEPLRGPGGQLSGVFVAFDDMTRVRRLEQLRTDFAANVSHELRTPITNIKGYLETLFEIGYDDPAQVSKFLEIVQRNANRLGALVEDVLLLAFLERPGAERQVSFVRAQVSEVVRDAVSQLEGAAAAKSMALEIEIDPSLTMLVDGALVSQAMLNLISNAIKYAPANTSIRVSAALQDGSISLCVADAGPGIDAMHIPRLFERFYRIESDRSRELGGTGLGLSIVKHIALLHGGRVDVHCPSDGGTVFTLVLPRGSRENHPV